MADAKDIHWLRLYEASDILRVDRTTVRHWVQNYLDREHGEDVDGLVLPGYTSPGSSHIFVREDELAVFVKEYADELEEIYESRASR